MVFTHSTAAHAVVRVPAPTPPTNYEASYAQLFAEEGHRAYKQMRSNARWSPHDDEGALPVGYTTPHDFADPVLTQQQMQQQQMQQHLCCLS